MTAIAVEVHDATYSHGGGFALRVPHLRVMAGERVAVVGPSGSGKTTLLDLIAGIRVPQTGRIEVLGHEMSLLPEPRRREVRFSQIGMAFQEFELLEYLSARENILLSEYVGGRAAGAGEELAALARESGIEHTLDRPPAKLSQGERQRVALCRALLSRPKLILCDEPTGNLDRRSADTVIELLFRHAERAGAAVVMATHDQSLLPRFGRTIDVAAWSGGGR